MGSTIGVILIVTMLVIMWVTKERKEMKKIGHLYFNACIFNSLYSYLLFDFYSFNQAGDMNRFTGLTLEHYTTMFNDQRLMLILVETFLLAFLSSLLATVIGTFRRF